MSELSERELARLAVTCNLPWGTPQGLQVLELDGNPTLHYRDVPLIQCGNYDDMNGMLNALIVIATLAAERNIPDERKLRATPRKSAETVGEYSIL